MKMHFLCSLGNVVGKGVSKVIGKYIGKCIFAKGTVPIHK